MVVIRWLLLSLFITLSTYAQFDWFDKSKQNYHIYTPITNDAVNITQYSATISGRNLRVKSNKFDTLATKKSVQNWMVWGVDSTVIVPDSWEVGAGWSVSNDTLFCDGSQELNSSVYMLPDGKGYFLTSGLDSIYYSFKLFDYVAGQLNLILFFSSGSVILPLAEANTTYSGYIPNFQHNDVRVGFRGDANFVGKITDIITYSFAQDSVQGQSYNINNLNSGTEYSYYHSIFVRANDGDTDYYQGDTKTFTTASLPVAPLLATEDGNYIITEDGNYITF